MIEKAILDFCGKYGLLGFMSALPTTPDFWEEENEEWYFSIVDVVGILTEQPTPRGATLYWGKLKQRLKEEGSELLTYCQQLKLKAADGKDTTPMSPKLSTPDCSSVIAVSSSACSRSYSDDNISNRLSVMRLATMSS